MMRISSRENLHLLLGRQVAALAVLNNLNPFSGIEMI